MALPYPSKGKPRDPRDENQIDRDMVCMKPIPEVGTIDKKKFAPGEFGGRVQRVGRKK